MCSKPLIKIYNIKKKPVDQPYNTACWYHWLSPHPEIRRGTWKNCCNITISLESSRSVEISLRTTTICRFCVDSIELISYRDNHLRRRRLFPLWSGPSSFRLFRLFRSLRSLRWRRNVGFLPFLEAFGRLPLLRFSSSLTTNTRSNAG